MEIPTLANLVDGSKHIYTLKDNDEMLVKVSLKATLETDNKMIDISKGHRNICRIETCYYDGITYYIYLEKLNGCDLFEYISKNRMNSEIVRDIMIQTLEGLQYLHKKGVVHGDIKLENTFMCNNGTIKIIDFGLSKWIENLDINCGGSYPYISPEVFLSSNSFNITEKLDVWSLGIMLYVLVEGKYPFISYADESEYLRVLKNKFNEIKINEDNSNFEKIIGIDKNIWDPILLGMIKKMIVYDPLKRITVDELLEMLYQETVDI